MKVLLAMFSTFREECITMVMLLLQFTKAERTNDLSLNLRATSEMIPYFFAMDRDNYAGQLNSSLLCGHDCAYCRRSFLLFFLLLLFCHTTDNSTEIVIK